MAVKDGSGPRPAPQPAKRRFLNCLETIASTLAFSCRPLGSEDRAAGFKHHGSEGRIGPAAGTPACQTSLSELPRYIASTLAFSCRQLESEDPRTVPQASNTMAVKDGSGPRPAPQPAKRRFLNCLETIASTLAFSCRQLESEDPRTVPQASNTMAVKDGSGPRPAPQPAKRRFLNCLETIASTLAFSCRQLGSEDRAAGLKHHETSLSELPRNYSFNPCFFLPSARVRGPCRRPQTPWQWRTDRARGRHPSLPNVAFWTACRQLGYEDPRTVPQASNTMAVKDGSGPRPAPQPAKRRFLNCLDI